MYPVSEAFLQAVQENTRRYYWTGRITTTKGVTYEFGADDIVKGSGYISSQCCGTTEIEIGTVYAAEMGITLLSDIDRYTLEDTGGSRCRAFDEGIGKSGNGSVAYLTGKDDEGIIIRRKTILCRLKSMQYRFLFVRFK